MTHLRPIPRQMKAASVNPLKMSAPLGAAMAYLGMDRCLPLFHGSQGCTAFALVLLVRHFREAIPFQTTAMNEIATILGGMDHVEQAVVNIAKRAKPRLIGICSTGLTETRGEDVAPDLPTIRARNPELAETQLVFAATPDYAGGMQEGWAMAVEAMVEAFVPQTPRPRRAKHINILAGCHLSPGDVEALKEMVEAFGLTATVLPDLSGSLDGHVPDAYVGTTYGGTTLEQVAAMGEAVATIAIGEHMRRPAEKLEARTGVPTHLLPGLTGLEATDRLMVLLSDLSGTPVPPRLRRQRSQLVDAMLDSHFFFGGRKVAIAAEPDLLAALHGLFSGLGAETAVALTTVSTPAVERLDAPVRIGDLEDLETAAVEQGCHLLVTHSHGRQAAARTGIPLYHAGFPQFDQLGAATKVMIGYRGTRDQVFALGNLFLHALHHDHSHAEDHGHDDRSHPTAG